MLDLSCCFRRARGRTFPMLALAAGLAACTQASIAPVMEDTPNVTNAPVYTSIQPGSEEDLMLNVGRRTYFTEASATLDDTAKATLDAQAEWLNTHSQWNVKLQGFSDDPGTPEQNVALSQKRAEAVRDYLASKGVDPARMWAKGYGRDRLIRDCPQIECKSQNRRVVTNPGAYPEITQQQVAQR